MVSKPALRRVVSWTALTVSLVLEATHGSSIPKEDVLLCHLQLQSRLEPVEQVVHSQSPRVASSELVLCQLIQQDRLTPYLYHFAPHPDLHGTDAPVALDHVRDRLRHRPDDPLVLRVPRGRLEDGRVLVPPEVHPTLESLSSHGRTLQQQTQLLYRPAPSGTRTALVLRIVASDAAPTPTREDLYYYLWDSPVSFRSQLLACSVGRLSIQPTSYGVLDIRVNLSARGRNYMDLVNAAYDAALLQIRASGAASLVDVRELADLLLFVVPPGAVAPDRSGRSQSEWAAFGAIPGQQSVFNDRWATYLGGIAHEVGHNFGLMHAWEAGLNYGDVSGFMGAAVTQVEFPRRCFNGQNHWQLGWYSDRAISVDPAASPGIYTVAAFVDYSLTRPNEYVVIEIQGLALYLQYNRAKSFNVDTGDHMDRLTITQQTEDGTNMITSLDMSEPTFTVGQSLWLEVCSVVFGVEGQSADRIMLSVSRDRSLCSEYTTGGGMDTTDVETVEGRQEDVEQTTPDGGDVTTSTGAPTPTPTYGGNDTDESQTDTPRTSAPETTVYEERGDDIDTQTDDQQDAEPETTEADEPERTEDPAEDDRSSQGDDGDDRADDEVEPKNTERNGGDDDGEGDDTVDAPSSRPSNDKSDDQGQENVDGINDDRQDEYDEPVTKDGDRENESSEKPANTTVSQRGGKSSTDKAKGDLPRSRQGLPEHLITLILAIVFVLVSFPIIHSYWHSKDIKSHLLRRRRRRRTFADPEMYPCNTAVDDPAAEAFDSEDPSGCESYASETIDYMNNPLAHLAHMYFDVELPTSPQAVDGSMA